MAEQEGKQALMIQLPWTVPQQPNVQTIVLQQPAKTHMELNASTDKTAISSFVLSVVIALILGLLATWLAYWYGRKSFKLTEMSFKTVIQQIQASEQSALDLNKRLFEQQLELKNRSNQFEMQKMIIERFRHAAEKFTIDAELFLSSVVLLHLSHEQFEFPEKMEIIRSYEYEVFIGINNKFDNLFESRSKLLFAALEMEVYIYDEIDQAISETMRIATSVKNRLVRGRDKLMSDVKECKTAIDKNKVIFKRILEKKAA